jgi:hypothetical protein
MKREREYRWLKALERLVLSGAIASMVAAVAYPEGYALTHYCPVKTRTNSID